MTDAAHNERKESKAIQVRCPVEEIEWTGKIVSRRVMGRSLAFCTIQCDDVNPTLSNKATTIVKLMFQAQTVRGDCFPSKKSALPFGGVLKVCCLPPCDHDETYRVTTYHLQSDPRAQAQLHARDTATGGISNSDYLRLRHEYHQQTAGNNCNSHSTPLRSIPTKKKQKVAATCSSTTNPHASSPRTHKVFAQFIAKHLLQKNGTDRILDVAGGKGRLSMELASVHHVPTTVMDPLQRKPLNFKRLVKQSLPVPQYQYGHFVHPERSKLDAAPTLLALENHTIIVGLHSDQATEDIVDLSLQYNKSFAVVPCCVFADLFSTRRIRGTVPVRSYGDFLEYLRAKHPGIQSIQLDFEGKNICLYKV